MVKTTTSSLPPMLSRDGSKSAPPTTPSQINKFFDTCTEWMMTSQGVESVPYDVVRLPVDATTEGIASHNLGLRDTDVLINPERACIACSTPTRERCVANPFCQAYLLHMCGACRAAMDGSSAG